MLSALIDAFRNLVDAMPDWVLRAGLFGVVVYLAMVVFRGKPSDRKAAVRRAL